LCALRWGSVDLEGAELLILRNVFQAAGRLVEKDTKTHAARRLALSDDSVGLLEEHRRRCAERAEACGVRLSGEDRPRWRGATTLRVYTHFLAAADRQAAEVLEKTLRRPRWSSSQR
jgi:hypothetical protein